MKKCSKDLIFKQGSSLILNDRSKSGKLRDWKVYKEKSLANEDVFDMDKILSLQVA